MSPGVHISNTPAFTGFVNLSFDRNCGALEFSPLAIVYPLLQGKHIRSPKVAAGLYSLEKAQIMDVIRIRSEIEHPTPPKTFGQGRVQKL